MKRTTLAANWARLTGPSRIAGIDLARGLAVLGMFAAHLLAVPDEFAWSDASTWLAVVDGRSSILFATLAGVSIGIVTGGPTPLHGEAMRVARRRLMVRAVILWVLGLLLILTGVPVFVILPAYAVLFFLAIPFTGLRASVLLPVAWVLAVVMPIVQVSLDDAEIWRTTEGSELSLLIGYEYPFTTWIVFVLAGLGIARAGLRRTRVQVTGVIAGAALAAAAYAWDAAAAVPEASEGDSFWSALLTARPHSSGLLEVVGSGGFAIAVIGASLLVCRTVLVWVALPVRAVGAMPLTAYTAQLLIWWLVALTVLDSVRDLGGFRDLEPFWPITVIVVLGCTTWAVLVGRGPLEWATARISRALVPSAPVGRLDG